MSETKRTKKITEYLEIDLEDRTWQCSHCTEVIGPADENYKRGCMVRERDPREVHPPLIEDEEYTFGPDPEWVRIVEFYCPGCGMMVENEYLPPGHPITHDTELDIDALVGESEGGR